MSENMITIRGAREHNLKNINVTFPRDKLVVISGLSGSGKSSLAFDTLFAEGQRRYMESLSSYARQFLGRMDKPFFRAIDWERKASVRVLNQRLRPTTTSQLRRPCSYKASPLHQTLPDGLVR